MSETNEKSQASKAQKATTAKPEATTAKEANRNDLRLAFIQAGSVRVQHVRADAQQVERAIDELLAMWDEK